MPSGDDGSRVRTKTYGDQKLLIVIDEAFKIGAVIINIP